MRPLAVRLKGVSPTLITFLGMLCSLGGGIGFAVSDRYPAGFLAAGLLGIVWGALDLLDGMVARIHGKTSEWGDFADHAADRIGQALCLSGLIYAESSNDLLIVAALVISLLQGDLGTQIQASFGRRSYRGMGMAEAMTFSVIYCFSLYAIRALGLPFSYDVPVLGRISAVDAGAWVGVPIITIGTFQRIVVAWRLQKERDAERKGS